MKYSNLLACLSEIQNLKFSPKGLYHGSMIYDTDILPNMDYYYELEVDNYSSIPWGDMRFLADKIVASEVEIKEHDCRICIRQIDGKTGYTTWTVSYV